MDTKEWFQQKKKIIQKMSDEYGWGNSTDFRTSEIYRDPNDKSLEWEICIICRKLEKEDAING